MKNLPAPVRNKAVEIANALLEERNMDEGIVIATAISRAKDWAVNHGVRSEAARGRSHRTDVKEHGEDRYVVPKEGRWAVKAEGRKRVEDVYDTKKEAVQHARQEAREANASLTIQRRDGRVEKRVSYNPHNTGKKTR